MAIAGFKDMLETVEKEVAASGSAGAMQNAQFAFVTSDHQPATWTRLVASGTLNIDYTPPKTPVASITVWTGQKEVTIKPGKNAIPVRAGDWIIYALAADNVGTLILQYSIS